MQKQLLKAQEDAESITDEGTSGGGMVKVTASGKNQLVAVEIEKEVVDADDVEMLQDLILAASNEALRKVQERVKAEVGKVTGGLNIPGM